MAAQMAWQQQQEQQQEQQQQMMMMMMMGLPAGQMVVSLLPWVQMTRWVHVASLSCPAG
jgi:hypothetical protein